MFLKTFLIAAPVVLGGLYIAGSFDVSADGQPVELATQLEPAAGKIGDPATCRKYFQKFEADGMRDPIDSVDRERNLAGGMETILRVNRMAAEADRLGCTDKVQAKIRELGDTMDAADDQMVGDSSDRVIPTTPGKPMLDARPPSERD